MTKSLPANPSLESLKKEAKAILKDHKNGDPSCCEVLRNLHHFKEKPDGKILSVRISLVEAQFALAMEYGFENWAQLKENVLSVVETPVFSTTNAWGAIDKGVKEVEELPDDILSQVLGITVMGSLVRGDFVEGRSDVALCTLYHASLTEPWASPAHAQVRRCLDKHLGPYARHNGNPYGWDDVCVSGATLPLSPEQAGHHRIRALGIYYFDTLKYHKTVWGEDFTQFMPPPVDPKPLIPEWLNTLSSRAEEIVSDDYKDQIRMTLLCRGAVSALTVRFGNEPSLHKDDITRGYKKDVPKFPEKELGHTLWNDYLYGDLTYNEELPRPFEEYHSFLHAAKRVVEENRVTG